MTVSLYEIACTKFKSGNLKKEDTHETTKQLNIPLNVMDSFLQIVNDFKMGMKID